LSAAFDSDLRTSAQSYEQDQLQKRRTGVSAPHLF
jgi:hypothetical protein